MPITVPSRTDKVNHDEISTTCLAREDMGCFLRWCWAALRWDIVPDDAGIEWLRVPDEYRDRLGGCEAIPVAGGDAAGAAASELPQPASWQDVLRMLGSVDQVAHATPTHQPGSVHELTPRLFDAYSVDGGRVMLGGCSLEVQPLLRSTGLVVCDDNSQPLQLVHRFSTVEGQPVDPRLVSSLHLDQLSPLSRPAGVPSVDLATWLATGRRQLAETHLEKAVEPLLVTVVWCKFLRCKLTFEIGETRADLPFSSWAQWLADGEISPPPFRCPHTGRESFHVVLDDDGVMTVAEAIAECEHTGRRVVETSLAVCDLTGQRVLRSLLVPCPVTGQQLMADHRIACTMCAQQVSPKAISGGKCLACQSLRAAGGNDPRLGSVLERYPKLRQWSSWRMSETEKAWILRASSVFRRLLVVVDRHSLDPLHLAERSLLSSRWSPVPADRWDQHLTP